MPYKHNYNNCIQFIILSVKGQMTPQTSGSFQTECKTMMKAKDQGLQLKFDGFLKTFGYSESHSESQW